ncbi:ribonuclease H-like domain-containing protein [Tanacetum coccineum]
MAFRHKYNADDTLSYTKLPVGEWPALSLHVLMLKRLLARLFIPATIQLFNMRQLLVSRLQHPDQAYAARVGFIHSRCDTSLFISTVRSGYRLLGFLYRDDIILTASSQLSSEYLYMPSFSMTDLGPLNYFLGISVTRNTSGMFLSQQKYASELLERAGMLTCNPCRTPVDTDSSFLLMAGLSLSTSIIPRASFLCSQAILRIFEIGLGAPLHVSIKYTKADCLLTVLCSFPERRAKRETKKDNWLRRSKLCTQREEERCSAMTTIKKAAPYLKSPSLSFVPSWLRLATLPYFMACRFFQQKLSALKTREERLLLRLYLQ